MKQIILAGILMFCGASKVATQSPEPPKRPVVVIDNLDLQNGLLKAGSGAHETVTSPSDSNPLTTGTGKPDLDRIITEAAGKYGLDPNLLVSVMRQESGFHERAMSYKGASGLMQLMPATARRFGVRNLLDPKENVHAGAQYLRFLLDLFGGDVKLALAAYNAGEGAVIKHGNRLPPYAETRSYVGSILARYQPGETLGGRASQQQASSAITFIPKAAVFVTKSGRLLFSNNY